MSRSPTITDDNAWSRDPADWLGNPHAGEMLDSEFLRPLAMARSELAAAIAVDVDRIDDVVAGRKRMDADLDLRLGRYFRMSPGFFLRLQTQHELIEARRQGGDELDRIVPRAA